MVEIIYFVFNKCSSLVLDAWLHISHSRGLASNNNANRMHQRQPRCFNMILSVVLTLQVQSFGVSLPPLSCVSWTRQNARVHHIRPQMASPQLSTSHLPSSYVLYNRHHPPNQDLASPQHDTRLPFLIYTTSIATIQMEYFLVLATFSITCPRLSLGMSSPSAPSLL